MVTGLTTSKNVSNTKNFTKHNKKLFYFILFFINNFIIKTHCMKRSKDRLSVL